MRREQILKICLNHVLTKDIEYAPKDDRTWLFSCADYSDGEISYRQFCLRFKNAEIAKQFKDAIEKALGEESELSSEKIIEDAKSNEDDDDCVIVYELKVTPEEEKKALALQLPKNFYAYLQKPPCKGCIGCNPDDFVFDTPKTEKIPSKSEVFTPISTSTPDSVPDTVTFSQNTPSQEKSQVTIFGGTKTPVTFSFMSQPITSSVAQTSANKSPLAPSKLATSGSIFSAPSAQAPKTMFSGTNIFGGAQKSETIFGGAPASGVVTKTSSENPILGFPKTDASNTLTGFGSTPPVTMQTTIFGGCPQGVEKTENIFGQNQNIFGTPKADSTTPIFGSQQKNANVPVFGSSVGHSFGSFAQASQQDPEVLQCDSGLSFAALASENQSFIKKGTLY